MQNLSSISCHKNEWKNDDKLRSFLFSVAKTIRDIDLKFGVHPINYFSILWEFFQEILRGSGGKIFRNLMNWDGLTHKEKWKKNNKIFFLIHNDLTSSALPEQKQKTLGSWLAKSLANLASKTFCFKILFFFFYRFFYFWTYST